MPSPPFFSCIIPPGTEANGLIRLGQGLAFGPICAPKAVVSTKGKLFEHLESSQVTLEIGQYEGPN